MLILTRNINQTVHVGDDITVTVPAVNGHQISIGVEAPKNIPVHREEVYRRIQAARTEHDEP